MSKTRSPKNLAKMLAYVLGRQPDEFALIPDAEGFVKIKDLLKALHEEDGWGYVNESHFREVVFTVPAPALEIDAQRVRACKRLALNVEPPTDRPPKLLYAHVRRRAYPWVHANGIHPSSHSHVVLAAQLAIAERLGRRIDPDPVILTVNVRAAEEQGVREQRMRGLALKVEQQRHEDVLAILTSPDTREFSLRPSIGRTTMTDIRVFWNDGKGLLMIGARLSPPTAGRAFQLWVIMKDRTAAACGIFRPDLDRNASLLAAPKASLTEAQALWITEEPEGGSTQPTSSPLWEARLR